MAIGFMLLYTKLADVLSKEALFYTVIFPFIAFFGAFGYLLYPMRDAIHPTALADRLLAALGPMEGDQFTLADIAVGSYARRWLGVDGITRPAQPHLTRWLAELAQRTGFAQYVAPPMS
jgi:hypothetical protein